MDFYIQKYMKLQKAKTSILVPKLQNLNISICIKTNKTKSPELSLPVSVYPYLVSLRELLNLPLLQPKDAQVSHYRSLSLILREERKEGMKRYAL